MSTILSDHAWERIHPLLAANPNIRLTHRTRLFLDAWLWMLRTGAQWRELPERFGKWNSVYKRMARWSALDVFDEVLERISRDADYEWLMVDSTTCRAHMSAAGVQAGNRPRAWDEAEAGSPPSSISRRMRWGCPWRSR